MNKNNAIKQFDNYINTNFPESIYLDILDIDRPENVNNEVIRTLNRNKFLIFKSFLTHNEVSLLMKQLFKHKNLLISKFENAIRNEKNDIITNVNLFHLIGACSRLNLYKDISIVFPKERNTGIITISYENMGILKTNEITKHVKKLQDYLSDDIRLKNFYRKYILYYYGVDKIIDELGKLLYSSNSNRASHFLPIINTIGRNLLLPPSLKKKVEYLKTDLNLFLNKLPKTFLQNYDIGGIINSWNVRDFD